MLELLEDSDYADRFAGGLFLHAFLNTTDYHRLHVPASVVMTADVGRTLRKGEEFGCFQFGGSDHVVIFEAGAGVRLIARPGEHYNQGVQIGTSG